MSTTGRQAVDAEAAAPRASPSDGSTLPPTARAIFSTSAAASREPVRPDRCTAERTLSGTNGAVSGTYHYQVGIE